MFNLLVLIFVCDLADIPEKPLSTHPLIKLTESSIFKKYENRRGRKKGISGGRGNHRELWI